MLCATMAVTTTMGVDLGFSWVFLGVFPFDFLSYSCYSKYLSYRNPMNHLSVIVILLEPQLEFRMSPSFSLVSLFWCRVKLWHDVGIDKNRKE